MLIEVFDTGEMSEITNHETTLKEDGVYLLLSYRTKRSYIWTGKNASVRKRFIAAKEARRIKMETGFQTFNVQHDDMYNEFEEDFAAYMNDLKTHTKLPSVLQEQRERMRKEGMSFVPENLQVAKEEQVKSEVKEPKLTEDEVLEIVKVFSNKEKPKNKIRDYIIVNNSVYSVNETAETLEIEKLSDIPNGLFAAKPYEPRILIQNGKVMGIELWRSG